jgi:N-methylhydantoinase A
VLSGPAGGVIGARAIARQCRVSPALSLDMGGTSTDVSLLTADPGWTTRAAIDGLPIALPMVDVHTIGAGGGSLAAVDAGGALRVGPRSAGADPGPAAYGRGGTQPTVTDANLVLGRLPPDTFTAGGLQPDPEAAARALDRLAEQAGLVPPPGLDRAAAAALGVIEVVNAHMARACRVVSLERGQDPADLTLIAFGGAAGLHAADLPGSWESGG